MRAAPEWLPSLDADTTASVIEDGLELLSGVGSSAAAAGVELAGLSNPALLVLGAVAAPIANAKLVELSKKADLRLQQYVEETDGDEAAYLRRLASGVSHLLPDGDKLEDAAVEAARGDPERLREILERYAGEDRSELENAVDRVLRGDFDDMEEELCEAFGTGNVDEAQALFMDFRDVVEDRRVHETFERVLGVEERLDDVVQELRRTRGELHDRFDSVLKRDLWGEGVKRLGPTDFEKEIDEPEVAWRAGFDHVHVRGGFAAARESRQNEDRTVTDDLLRSLRGGDDRMIVGSAGSGKSTVCKSVACEWYDRAETGPVFYRQSGRSEFRDQGPLKSAVRRSERRALVVIEDAVRPEAEDVFEAVSDLDDEPVSFLFDARRGDFDDDWRPGGLESGIQGLLEEAFEATEEYPLPDALSAAKSRM